MVLAMGRGAVHPVYREIGKRIQKCRSLRELSQADLVKALKARGLDLSRASLTNIENGRHRIQVHILFHIAEALGVGIRDLLPKSIAPGSEYPFQQAVSDSDRAAIERVAVSKKGGTRHVGS